MIQTSQLVEPGFEQLAAVFRSLFDQPGRGGALSVYIDGRPVIDVWEGEKRLGVAWTPGTLVCGFSTGKGLLALIAEILVDRGQLDIDKRVAEYWPEFSQSGKGNILVKHLLTHQAGLPFWDGQAELVSLDDPGSFLRTPEIVAALEKAQPQWEAGSAFGYHSFTMGWLMGELIRRVSGKSVERFLLEDVAAPLGARFRWGVPATNQHLLANTIPDPAYDSDETFAVFNSQTPSGRALMLGPKRRLGTAMHKSINDSTYRQAVVASAGLQTDAASLARLYALLAQGGELDGCRLVSAESIALFTEERFNGPDIYQPQFMRVGLGYMLNRLGTDFEFCPSPSGFGHPGLGGATGFADPDAKVGFGFVPNQMVMAPGADPRAKLLATTLYEKL